MKKKIFLLSTIAASMLFTSCFSTRTYVGSYREDKREAKESTYTYAKGKQGYLLWGLIPLGRTTLATPQDGSCEIRTHHGFGDVIVSLLTGGIFSMQTVKVKASHAKKSQTPQYTAPAQQQSTQQNAASSDAELDAIKQMLQ